MSRLVLPYQLHQFVLSYSSIWETYPVQLGNGEQTEANESEHCWAVVEALG